ncbi:MAG: class I SAM-dependent methyltransferase [Verrucomicrobia bacterium]|nr:class I SAM-dependent methyltransferase [Verrucomicrobiota bacterium]
MTHAETIARWLPPRTGLHGVEIGPGTSPVPGLDPRPVYVDCFKSFGAEPNLADFYGHATALPFHDHSLDYVIASHVLEHAANPVAALAEWYRVVRPGGLLYFVVPDRRATWDHSRTLTPVSHLLDDYLRGTTACDPTHIDEFAGEVDWSRFEPATPAEDVPGRRADFARGLHEMVRRGEDINIHFHTFEPANVEELLATLTCWPPCRLRWELLHLAAPFPADCPNGILAVLRVHKGWLARAQAEAFRIRTGGVPAAALRPEAEPFAEWASRTPGLGGVR